MSLWTSRISLCCSTSRPLRNRCITKVDWRFFWISVTFLIASTNNIKHSLLFSTNNYWTLNIVSWNFSFKFTYLTFAKILYHTSWVCYVFFQFRTMGQQPILYQQPYDTLLSISHVLGSFSSGMLYDILSDKIWKPKA